MPLVVMDTALSTNSLLYFEKRALRRPFAFEESVRIDSSVIGNVALFNLSGSSGDPNELHKLKR